MRLLLCFSGLLGLYLFFKVSWTAPILSDWHCLFLDSESLPKFGPGGQQEGMVVGWELGQAVELVFEN